MLFYLFDPSTENNFQELDLSIDVAFVTYFVPSAEDIRVSNEASILFHILTGSMYSREIVTFQKAYDRIHHGDLPGTYLPTDRFDAWKECVS